MAAKELDVIAKRKKFCANGIQQGRGIAIGEIRAPN
jgi:hypothetical protein